MKSLVKSLLILSLIMLQLHSKAQSTWEFNQSRWMLLRCLGFNNCDTINHYAGFYSSDTIINSISYKKICAEDTTCDINLGNAWSFPLAVRSDNHRLHIVQYDTWGVDLEEHLVYDFNLNTGDTLKNSPDWYGIFHDYMILDKDYVSINNAAHVFQKVQDITSLTNYYFIEGIGSNLGGILPYTPSPEPYTISCYSFKDTIVLLNFNIAVSPQIDTSILTTLYSNNGCYDIINTINSFSKIDNLELYPNPSQGQFQISNLEKYLNQNLLIYDLLGNIVFETVITKKEENININPKGLFILKITNKEGCIISKKITIQ